MSNLNPDPAMGCAQAGCPMHAACGRYIDTVPKGSWEVFTYWNFQTNDIRKEVRCNGYLGRRRR